MNNDFYKNAYDNLVKHIKKLLSNCQPNEYLLVSIYENDRATQIQSISYIGCGLVSITFNRNVGKVLCLQDAPIRFEYADISKRNPDYSFQIEELDPHIQA